MVFSEAISGILASPDQALLARYDISLRCRILIAIGGLADIEPRQSGSIYAYVAPAKIEAVNPAPQAGAPDFTSL
jgi:hypothetical protein